MRLREPGFEYRATLESEMLPPLPAASPRWPARPTHDPPLDERGWWKCLKFRAKNLPGPRVYPIGAMTQKLEGKMLTELAELTEAGCRAFNQPMPCDRHPVCCCVRWNTPPPSATACGCGRRMHRWRAAAWRTTAPSPRASVCPASALAETVALAYHPATTGARETGARVHVRALSTYEGIAMVRAAKAQGLAVTCDVAATHVHLSENDLISFDSHLHLVPPLRSTARPRCHREALRDGSIDALCSDTPRSTMT